ncbi:hypothetical protein HY642_06540 [Candidatus Woesearchaeota archaeon]|nr:hypothetical protein [Candidatus Woesearchaeota archaeon]
MIFDERDRQAKVCIEGTRSASITPQEGLEVLFDLNQAMMKLCIESIRARNPNVSERELLREVKRIYALR